MFVKFAYLLGYIKIYFYKLVYRNNFTFGKKILPSFDISINILENSQIVIGNNFYFRKGVVLRLQNESNLIIGNNVFLNDGCKITCLKKIHIGNDVRIGQNVLMYDHDHVFQGNDVIDNQGMVCDEIIIEDNVWIGSNVIILRGSKIRSGSVIAAGTIVKGEIAPNSLVIDKQNLTIKPKGIVG